MPIKFVGNCDFEDCCEPFGSKNEFGVDVLQRRMRGRADRLQQFIASLRQGAPLAGNGSNGSPGLSSGQSGGPVGQSGFMGPQGFYLQTWYADDHPVFPTVLLTYKGITGGAFPEPHISHGMVSQTASITRTSTIIGNPDITSRTRVFDIQYNAPLVTIRWVQSTAKPQERPTTPIGTPRIVNSRWKTVNPIPGEAQEGSGYPSGISYQPQQHSFSSNPIYGTPYFEIEESIVMAVV